MFENLLETQKKILLNDIKSQTLSHAYLFYGSNDEILYKTSLDFIKTLLCTNDEYFCDVCDTCIKINTNNAVDISNIYKDENTIKIKQIRKMQDETYLTSVELPYKIFIIHEAQVMGIEASNAFLKTLEEPTKDNIIILLANSKENLLPTILSRCTSIKVTKNSSASVLTKAEKTYLIDSILSVFEGVGTNNVNISEKVGKDKKNCENYCIFLMKFLCDVLIYKQSAINIDSKDNKDIDYLYYVKEVNKKVTKEHLKKIIDKMMYIIEGIKFGANAPLGILSLFMCIQEES